MNDQDLIRRNDVQAIPMLGMTVTAIERAICGIPAVHVATPPWLANCIVCGRVVDTREETEGGDSHGCGYDGVWVCSSECDEQFVASAGQDATLAPESCMSADVLALVKAAILDGQIRAFERGGVDTPEELTQHALARMNGDTP